MAEIDKGLPNVKRNITLPSQDELTEVQTAVQETVPSHEGTEITENEDGSVEVLRTPDEKGAYTILHKLIFNIKKLFAKVPGLRTKVGTYAAALFLLKDTFKEHVEDPDVFEKEFMKYLKEEGYELDDSISEEVIGFGEILPKGKYVLVNDILNKEEEELSAKKGDEVVAYDDEAPIDTVLGVEIFPVVHVKTQEKIYVSLEDIKDEN